MNKKIYIDGNFLLKRGSFYGLDFCIYVDDKYKDLCDETIHCNEKGIYEVSIDGGSMFNSYYVKGGITIYGNERCCLKSFKNDHEQTYSKYKNIRNNIIKLIEEAVVPKECENYFYMQQYASLVANLEYYLYGTFLWETCQNYDFYNKALRILKNYVKQSDWKIKQILKGKHCIKQENIFLKQVKQIVYHNIIKVKDIYKFTFNIDVDLNILKKEIDIRHDIVHRMGYTKEDSLVQISKEDVISLKNKIDGLVDGITLKIKEINKIKLSQCPTN